MHTGITLFSFAYDIILTILLVAIMSIAFCLWVVRRKSIALPVAGYFACCLLDTIIIFMTEAIPEFAVWYEQGFVYSPAIKTLVYIGVGFFTLYTWNSIQGQKFKTVQYLALTLLGAYLELIPLLPANALRAWLYFTAYQVFNISFCAYALWWLKGNEPAHSPITKKEMQRLLWVTIGMSLCILAEDTFVIFMIDNWQLLSPTIYNRNVSEDILRVYYVFFFLHAFWRYFNVPEGGTAPVAEAAQEQPEPEVIEAAQEQLTPVDVEEYKRIKFVRSIALSERETEVFCLLLQGNSNQQIGETLCISKGTVKAHIHNIFQKADVTQRRELLIKFEEFEVGN